MTNLDHIYEKDKSIEGFSTAYLKYLSKVLSEISVDEIAAFIKVLLNAREQGTTIYFIGNGGSAATSSHFANDIAIGTKSFAKPFRAVSLCDNQAILTAIANDDGYEKVFSQQLEVLLNDGDIVVAISASGNSPNLIAAVEVAKKKKAFTVGLTAFDGGELRNITDISIHIPTEKGEYGPAEDGHMILDHLIGNYLLRIVKDNYE